MARKPPVSYAAVELEPVEPPAPLQSAVHEVGAVAPARRGRPPAGRTLKEAVRTGYAVSRPGGPESTQAVCARPEHQGSQLTFGRRRGVVQKPRLTSAGQGSDDAAAIAGRRNMTSTYGPPEIEQASKRSVVRRYVEALGAYAVSSSSPVRGAPQPGRRVDDPPRRPSRTPSGAAMCTAWTPSTEMV
jgi:hypothetical protein